LIQFIEGQDFSKLKIDDALRKFLDCFQLPGEAQQVDRILEKFGEKYVKDNPGVYHSSSAAYTLSYAIIML